MNKKQPKLKFEEDKERTATRSPPKKEKVEQTQPRKKLKLDADKAAEKAQHLRFGKAEITPDEASRMTKAQKREMYASAIARSAAHREVDQYTPMQSCSLPARKTLNPPIESVFAPASQPATTMPSLSATRSLRKSLFLRNGRHGSSKIRSRKSKKPLQRPRNSPVSILP